jgi:hypothetical protein
MTEPSDEEYQAWTEEARYLFHERIGCLIGAAVATPEEADDIAREQVRGHLLQERKRMKNEKAGKL